MAGIHATETKTRLRESCLPVQSDCAFIYAIAILMLAAIGGCNRSAPSSPAKAQSQSKSKGAITPKPVTETKQRRYAAARSRSGQLSQAGNSPWSHYAPIPAHKYPDVSVGSRDDYRFSKLAELNGESAAISQIAISADSKRAVTSDVNGKLVFWDLEKRTRIAPHDVSNQGDITSIAISPDCKVALVAVRSGILTKWQMETGENIAKLDEHDQELDVVAFTPDPNIAAVMENGREIDFFTVDDMHIFDMIDINLAGQITSNGDQVNPQDRDRNLRLKFSDNGKVLLASNSKWCEVISSVLSSTSTGIGTSRTGFPFEKRGMLNIPCPLHRTIVDIAFIQENVYLAIAFDDGVISCISIAPRRDLNTPILSDHATADQPRLFGRPTSPRALMRSPGGNFFLAYGGGESVDMWSTGQQLAAARLVGRTDGVTAVAVCPNGTQALSGFGDGRLVLYRLPSPIEVIDDRLEKLLEQTVNALADGRFDEVEKVGEELRKAHRIGWSGSPEYAQYYLSLSSPKESNDLEWAKLFKRLEAWLAAKPKSAYARVALARAYHKYGWEARGNEFAGKVSAQGMEMFEESLKQAAKLLIEAQNLQPDDPAIYDADIRVGQGLGIGKERLMKMFEQGFKTDPKYYPLYTSLAPCLLPRWYGEPEDLAKFLDDVLKRVDAEEGLTIYAWVTRDIKCMHSTGEMRLLGLDMEKVRAGANILFKRYPYSNLANNLACWSACVNRDQEAARDLFGWLGDHTDLAVWRNEETFRRVRRWAMDRRQPTGQEKCILVGLNSCTSVAFSPDGKTIAVGGFEHPNHVTLWNSENGKLIGALPHEEEVRYVDYDPTGKHLVTAGGSDASSQLIVWTLGKEVIARPLEGPLGKLYCARFSSDGKRLAAGGEDDAVWIWQLDDEKSKPKQVKINERVISLDSKGDLFAVATEHKAAIIDPSTSRVTKTIHFTDSKVADSRFLGDEIVAGFLPFSVLKKSFDKAEPRRFDSKNNRTQNSAVDRIAVSPDGNLMAVAVNNGTFKDVPRISDILFFDTSSYKEVARYSAHTDRCIGVAFSPDGKRLASVGWDGTLRIWKVPDYAHTGK
jgi:WD40 repeat protein